MITILSFIFTLGLLVTIHEYGHFIVARWFDVKVLRFSVGFGKPLWQTTFGKDKTEFTLAAIPLGGYVKMLDEHEMKQSADSGEPANSYSEEELSRSFNRQSVYKRMAIVLAGPIANLLLAILLYCFLFSLGVVGLKPILGDVEDNSPAAKAGFITGDIIKTINGETVNNWQDVRWRLLNESTGDEAVTLEVSSNNNIIQSHQLDVSHINQDDTESDFLVQLGLTPNMPSVKPIIGVLSNDGAGKLAGLESRDLILSVEEHEVNTWQAFVELVRAKPNKTLPLLVERDGVRVALTLTPAGEEVNGQLIGKIGAGVYFPKNEMDHYFVTTKYTLIDSLIKASQKTWETSIFSLKMLGNMVIGNVSWKMMSGPVTIASYAGQSANMGVKVFIGFLALMSISIGVINLLPIPVLDGGHFMYYVIEFVTGEPVSESLMLIGHKIGLSLIGGMMFLAFYNDINRLITG